MTVRRIMGIETEYGVLQPGRPLANPMLLSSHVVAAHAVVDDAADPATRGATRRTRARWDYDDEDPLHDARGFRLQRASAHPSLLTDDPVLPAPSGDAPEALARPTVEEYEDPGAANVILTNGARLYVDHAHPEYSSPEVTSPLDAVRWDRAGELVMLASVRALAQNPVLPDVALYKNNVDGKGATYGTHENYMVDRAVPFTVLAERLTPFLVTRQVFTGAGRVGLGQRGQAPGFQLSQRAEFFEEVVGLETTLKRPIINTRDEPHSDAERFRRLHVIIGDANLSPVASAVKLGATALLLAALEDEGLAAFPPPPRDPVAALRSVALDLTLATTIELESGVAWTAWDLQDALWHLARDYVATCGAPAVAPEDEVAEILTQWREMLDGVRDDPDAVADRVDWVAKRRIVEGYRARYDLAPTDARLQAIDLQYHDLDPARSLAARVGLRALHETADIARAVTSPPTSTRAFFRGQCVARYPDDVVAANWDSVVFDLGTGPLHKVPTADPLRGTAALTADLFAHAPHARDLLTALEG